MCGLDSDAVALRVRRGRLHRLHRGVHTDKQAILEAHGYRVLRITWKQVTVQPRQTLARIQAARNGA